MSAKLSEEELNDYIAPGPVCVKPTAASKRSAEAPTRELEVGTEPSEPEKVSISLQDCLACAGCITSSEEVLLSRQSHTVFLKAWREMPQDRQLVISVAPQCRISLAQYFGLSLMEMDSALLSVFHSVLHSRYAVGTELGRAIAIQHTNERLQRVRDRTTPLLCSVCPGFVLYAEKTRPELVPLLLDVKSPQQVTAALLRQTLQPQTQTQAQTQPQPQPQRFYHLALMPCFDKKLEASRPDAQAEAVDCVLTPREFLAILQELHVDIARDHVHADLWGLAAQLSPPGWDPRVHWASNGGSSSGGFAYQYARLVSEQHPASVVRTLQGRNADVREHRVVGQDGRVLASASELYGFRNIQNMVRRLRGPKRGGARVRLRKRGPAQAAARADAQAAALPLTADPYSSEFIEVMACPGGCINGGGLLSGDTSATRRATAQLLDARYAAEFATVDPLRLNLGEASQRRYEYEFHAVEHHAASDPVAMSGAW